MTYVVCVTSHIIETCMSRIYFIEYFLEYRMYSLPAVCCSTKESEGRSSQQQRVAVRVAVCCSVLQYQREQGKERQCAALRVAVCCIVLQCVLQCVAVCCSTKESEERSSQRRFHEVILPCKSHQDRETLQHTLQHTATHCNTLLHTATHCNTLQHTVVRSSGSTR